MVRSSKTPAITRGSNSRVRKLQEKAAADEKREMEEQEGQDEESRPTSSSSDLKALSLDPLASINGIKPKVLLADGESRESKSRSSADKSYTQKRTMDHYYCNCPAWRMAGGAVDARTCKHLMALLGGAYEEVRIENADPGASEKMPGKKKGKDDDDEEDQGKKRKVVARALAPRKRKSPSLVDDDNDNEGEDGDEDEAEYEVPKVKKAVVTTSRKRKSPTPDDDDNNDVDEEEEEEQEEEGEDAPPTKRRTSSRKKASPSRLKDTSFNPLLAHKWDFETGRNPTDWWISEKLDGVRAIWHGNKGMFLSREGNPFYAPDWFTKRLPRGNIMLDGELFTKRGGFQNCVSIVRTQNRPDRWKFSVTYQVFDVPSMADAPFEDRLEWLTTKFSGKGAIRWVSVVEHEVCASRKHLFERLDEVCDAGGEGLMLREPGSHYVQGRARSLLKVKRFFDADAIVRGHERGSGKNSNCTGALCVEMLDNLGNPTRKMFKIGTGLTDKERVKPPKIGSVVIYRYQELSNSGTPRFPSYVGERAD
ncbi:hypothetical protein BDD12DRAFT_800512 [Trichophaea hybrida]|nr:hypothetical protein BDD12DRAFT_800512 [Trichophaea hybrida]